MKSVLCPENPQAERRVFCSRPTECCSRQTHLIKKINQNKFRLIYLHRDRIFLERIYYFSPPLELIEDLDRHNTGNSQPITSASFTSPFTKALVNEPFTASLTALTTAGSEDLWVFWGDYPALPLLRTVHWRPPQIRDPREHQDHHEECQRHALLPIWGLCC